MAEPVLSRRQLAAALLALLVLLPPPSSAARRKRPVSLVGRTIGSIRVETYNVFNTNVYPESKLVYRAANAVHRTSRESVVRRELLYEVGEPYDPNLIAETERNLRLLPFIRRADSDAVVNSSGTVDVVVRTYDSWSLEFTGNFKRVGGATEVKGGFTERNFLGRGTELSVEYLQNGTSPSKSIAWKEVQFLGRHHLNLLAAAAASPEGRDYSLAIGRPFYASIAQASMGVAGNYSEKRTTLYANDVPSGESLRRASEVGVSYGVALATSTWRTRRVRAGVSNRHVDYLPLPSTPPGALPAREQFIFLHLGFDWQELDFVTERRIQRFTRDEDYNVGLAVLPSVSWAPPLHGLRNSESQALPGLIVRKGFERENRLLLLRASYNSAFVNGANGGRVAGADALGFLMGLPRQTLAFHAAYDHGWRLDPGSRLALGESNGLRGYGLSQFTGERRLLMNVEDRVFLNEEWLRLVDVGAVVFYDAGYAWGQGVRARLVDLRHSVGFGLRLAASKSASNSPVRIDAARALNPNGTNSRWTLSILAGHAFGPD